MTMQNHPLAQRHATDTRRARRRRIALAAVAATVCCAALAAGNWWRNGSAAISAPATQSAGASVLVNLTGVAGTDGRVMAALCDRGHFLGQCAHMVTMAARPALQLRFDGVAPGAYAVMLFHDENSNGKFDTSAGGMPLEGYGFSRNARGRFAAPTFDDAAVEVRPGMAALDIAMVY